MNPPMTYSTAGEALTEKFEGCKLAAYQDQKGVWTIGYGHTAGVKEGDTCMQSQAAQWLMQDIEIALDAVNRLVTTDLTQPEFNSLVDFCFNLGAGNFESSTLLKLLNAGNITGAAAEFDKWDHCGGQVVAGLLRRRQAETDEFLSSATGVDS